MAGRDGHESDGSYQSSADDDNDIQDGEIAGSRIPGSGAASTSTSGPSAVSAPLQKRRRVTRACDCCRRKKIKCDGKQPCTHCTVYSYECTYDQPSNRRRNPTPQYIEALEGRVQRLSGLFKLLFPDGDIDDPNFEIDKLPKVQKILGDAFREERKAPSAPPPAPVTGNDQEALLETMVEATGRLDIDESGRLDFHGHSSGFTYLSKLREQFGDLLGPEIGTNTLLRLRPFRSGPQQSRSITNSPTSTYLSENVPLPRREVADELASSCLTEALLLFRFIHTPSFNRLVDRLYQLDYEDYSNEEHSFLPVFYLVLAVGCLFTRKADKIGIFNVLDEGVKYFGAGRRLTDVTDCRDVTSLQCVLLMILFLQSSAKLATCYSYIGIAVSASFRLGLHRKIPFPDPIESEVRRRIFCTIQKMDISISALIGLPRMIHDEDIDQEYPSEADDQYITNLGVNSEAIGKPNNMSAANAHTRLVQILGKVVKKIYPIKGVRPSSCGKRAGYMISYAVVREIEGDLSKWEDTLPEYLRRGDDSPSRFLRSQYLLQLSLAHVRMMLYRPFIHYIARPRDGRVRDERPFASAAACINTSRQIIHLCQQMREKDILGGAYWFLIYTTFFSVLSLIYFVLENITHPDAPMILRDATIGKDCIFSLKDSSMAGERCSLALKPLFDQLPNRLRDGFGSSQTRKRGRAPSPAVPVRPTSTDSGTNKNMPGVPHQLAGDPKSDALLGNQVLFDEFDDLGPEYNGIGDMKGNLTPYPPQDPKHSLQQHLGGFTGLPDLNALMFPASNAFVYGSQAMAFENSPPLSTRPVIQEGSVGSAPGTQNFGSPNSLDNVEVQLYGPLPPYSYTRDSFSAEDVKADSFYPMGTNPGVSSPGFTPLAFDVFSTDPHSQDPQSKMTTAYMDLDDFFSNGMNDAEWEQIIGGQRPR